MKWAEIVSFKQTKKDKLIENQVWLVWNSFERWKKWKANTQNDTSIECKTRRK